MYGRIRNSNRLGVFVKTCPASHFPVLNSHRCHRPLLAAIPAGGLLHRSIFQFHAGRQDSEYDCAVSAWINGLNLLILTAAFFLPTIANIKEYGLDIFGFSHVALKDTGLFYPKMDVQLGVAKADQLLDGEELGPALEFFNSWKPALTGSEPGWVDELHELIKQHVQETENA